MNSFGTFHEWGQSRSCVTVPLSARHRTHGTATGMQRCASPALSVHRLAPLALLHCVSGQQVHCKVWGGTGSPQLVPFVSFLLRPVCMDHPKSTAHARPFATFMSTRATAAAQSLAESSDAPIVTLALRPTSTTPLTVALPHLHPCTALTCSTSDPRENRIRGRAATRDLDPDPVLTLLHALCIDCLHDPLSTVYLHLGCDQYHRIGTPIPRVSATAKYPPAAHSNCLVVRGINGSHESSGRNLYVTFWHLHRLSQTA